MYNLVNVESENALKKLISEHRRNGEELRVLFISQWDQVCQNLMGALEEKRSEEGQTLYIVNSFDTPHSFVIWDTKHVPELVRVRRGKGGAPRTFKSSYTSDICRKLGLKDF